MPPSMGQVMQAQELRQQNSQQSQLSTSSGAGSSAAAAAALNVAMSQSSSAASGLGFSGLGEAFQQSHPALAQLSLGPAMVVGGSSSSGAGPLDSLSAPSSAASSVSIVSAPFSMAGFEAAVQQQSTSAIGPESAQHSVAPSPAITSTAVMSGMHSPILSTFGHHGHVNSSPIVQHGFQPVAQQQQQQQQAPPTPQQQQQQQQQMLAQSMNASAQPAHGVVGSLPESAQLAQQMSGAGASGTRSRAPSGAGGGPAPGFHAASAAAAAAALQAQHMSPVSTTSRQGHPMSPAEAALAGVSNTILPPLSADSQTVTPQAPPAQLNSHAAPAAAPESSGTEVIGQIGNLLDNVVALANNARAHFQQGQHNNSSLCLTDLQRALAQIGELGTRSLATVRSESSSSTAPAAPSDTSTAMDSTSHSHLAVQDESPTVKKRPMSKVMDDMQHPIKTLRTRDGTPVQPPSAPPSAPPYAHTTDPMQTALLKYPPPEPPASAPPLLHAMSAPNPLDMHNGMQESSMSISQPGSATHPTVSLPSSMPSSTVSLPQHFPESPGLAASSFRFTAPHAHAPKQPSNLGPGATREPNTLATSASMPSLPLAAANAAAAAAAAGNSVIPPSLKLSQMAQGGPRTSQLQQDAEAQDDSEMAEEGGDDDDEYDSDSWDDSGQASMINDAGHSRPPSDPALLAESSAKLNLDRNEDTPGTVVVGGAAVGDDKEPVAAAQIGPELKQQLDVIFWEYLNALCSDREYLDSRWLYAKRTAR